MLRWIFGASFIRWGLPGLLVAFLFVVACFWLLLVGLGWLINGVVYGLGLFSAFGYLLLLIFVIRWFRRRRNQEHLLEFGRRRWLE